MADERIYLAEESVELPGEKQAYAEKQAVDGSTVDFLHRATHIILRMLETDKVRQFDTTQSHDLRKLEPLKKCQPVRTPDR